jgi:hypothetical protein
MEKEKQYNNQLQLQLQGAKSKIKKGMKIKLDCEFCQGPILGNPHVFKFATYERFSAVLDAYLVTRKSMLEE